MAVMRAVWPINALWAGVFGFRAYWKIGRTGPFPHNPPRRLRQLRRRHGRSGHGAARFLAEHRRGDAALRRRVLPGRLGGSHAVSRRPVRVAASLVFGEWTLDYLIALLIGVDIPVRGAFSHAPANRAAYLVARAES